MKNNKIFKLFIAVIIMSIALISVSISSIAFDANDYDSGGSSDWSSSDWSSSDWSSSDYSSSDWGSSDYSSSGYSSGGAYGSSMAMAVLIGGLFIGIFGLVIGVSIFKAFKAPKRVQRTDITNGSAVNANAAKRLPDRTAEISQILQVMDSNFDARDFCNFAEQVWYQVQMAWCARDLEPVQALMATNLYNTTYKQVQAKIDANIVYTYEDISFSDTHLTSYIRDKEYEYLTVYTMAKYIDYQKDEITGQIVKGDLTTHWTIAYKMKFQRAFVPKYSIDTCPNCGAPLGNVGTMAKCIYCNTTITKVTSKWVLADFTSVRADTVDEGIRE